MVGELTPLTADPATNQLALLWLVPALPLLGAVVNLFVGRRLGKARPAGSATVLVVASFVIAAVCVVELVGAARRSSGSTSSTCSTGSPSGRSGSAPISGSTR